MKATKEGFVEFPRADPIHEVADAGQLRGALLCGNRPSNRRWPFTGAVERRVAIGKANRSKHITQFIAEFNETLVKDLPPGLASSAGVSLDGFRQGDDIVSTVLFIKAAVQISSSFARPEKDCCKD